MVTAGLLAIDAARLRQGLAKKPGRESAIAWASPACLGLENVKAPGAYAGGWLSEHLIGADLKRESGRSQPSSLPLQQRL